MENLFSWSKFVADGQLDEWETRLLLAGVPYTATKLVRNQRWQLCSYHTSREEAEALVIEYGGGVTRMSPMDWLPSAEPGGAPVVRIRDAIVITEAERETDLAEIRSNHPDRIVLSFPPQLAFGTGSHPTTAACLRFLVDFARDRRGGPPWRVLDLGCGSGILAIAAAKMGAAEVVAVETDAMALKYAKQNAQRHGVTECVRYHEGDAVALLRDAEEAPFDLIVANLFSSLLIEILPGFRASLKEGGELVISGFLTSQTREVVEAASSGGVRLVDFLRRGKWVAARGSVEND